MSTKSLAQLTILLNTPNLTNLPVVNLISGELTVTAVGPGPMDSVRVTIADGQTLNLLERAPQSWWAASTDLEDSVKNDWLDVLDPNALPFVPAPVLDLEPDYVINPAGAGIGDILRYDGTTWALMTPGTLGYVITSNGPGTLPTYQPAGGGGGSGDSLVVSGQTTTGLGDGDMAYISANSTWMAARSDGTLAQATLKGANCGVVGSMCFHGRVAAAKFTTAGGSPAAGAEVFLAANADDGGSGAGKLTATAPTSGYKVRAGVCLDNSDYAGLKTCIVLLNPEPPVDLG